MLIKFIVSLLPYFMYVILKSNTNFQMLQQNRYNDKYRYIRWVSKNLKNIFINENLLYILILLGFILKKSQLIMIAFIIINIICAMILLNKRKKSQKKLPLKFTSRVKRLFTTNIIIYLLPLIIICFDFSSKYLTIYYCIFSFLIYINSLYILLANMINKPIEKLVGLYFKKKAIRKIKNMTNLKTIGITGSYGKTSSKNILNDILDSKYNVLKTPKNFNTPFGLMLTINNNLDKFNDYFIAEMGACKKGEIKELCQLVKPTYGIITKIGVAHLETFKTKENIQKTKFELIESLPSYGIGILNADDERQVSYKIKNKCQIIWIGIDNQDADVRASNIKLSNNGMNFDVTFKEDKKKYSFSTKLLGQANIYNILSGIALGKELGISIEQLQMGVRKIKSIEHRLELKKYKGINLIDDAYNSNPIGSKMALDVLKIMPGKKIIVTPGMIELGEEEYQLNKEFGKYIAESTDEVILVGKQQTKAIQDGLNEKLYNKNKIHIINDVLTAFDMIQKLQDGETYVLLENDLPDIFNEE